MLGIVPAADIAPIEIVAVDRSKQNQEGLIAAVFFGLEGQLIISPGGVAELHMHIRRQTGLDKFTSFNRPKPAAAAVQFKTAVPDQFAPQAAVDGMINMFEEMPIDLLVNCILNTGRIDRKRLLGNLNRPFVKFSVIDHRVPQPVAGQRLEFQRGFRRQPQPGQNGKIL